MVGLTQELTDALGAKVTEAQGRYAVEWADGGFVALDVTGDTVHFHHLQAGQPGTLTRMVATLPALFRAHGIKTFTTSLSTPESVAWITAVGFEERGDRFACDIAEGGRMDQYARWKAGGARPEWRRG